MPRPVQQPAKHRKLLLSIGLVVLVLAVAFLLGRVSKRCETTCSEQREDLSLQQEVINEINKENTALRFVNARLRDQTITAVENSSRMSLIITSYRERCPQLAFNTTEIPDPLPRVSISDVLVRKNDVLINVPEVQQGIIAASNSMDPLLDQNDVVLDVTPQNPADIQVGDIIIYRLESTRVIHRVIEIGHDNDGWYAITKGDNNPKPDPAQVRFDQVIGVVIGIIY